jgi:hypothetical protein
MAHIETDDFQEFEYYDDLILDEIEILDLE